MLLAHVSQRLRRAWQDFWDRARADRATLPTADPRLERIARLIAGLGWLGFVVAAVWEMGGPFGAGHYAAGPAFAVAAENSLKWGIIEPVPQYYTLSAPRPSEYYCHHPFGFFWVMASFLQVFGHHDWVVRAPAVLLSAATPPILYGIGRAIWGPVAGAVAVCSFVTLPIALAFANLGNLEVPTIFGVLLMTLGYVRFSQTWRRRWLLTSLLGLSFALFMDWPGYFFAGSILAFLALRGFVLRRLFPPLDSRGFAQFWALASCLGVAALLAHLYWFARANQLQDFVAQGGFRSAGADRPLKEILEGRRYWIEISFTPLAILIGKIMAPVLALRVLLLRRDLEAFPLAMLVMAVVHYVVFKNGADIHIFWSHYFAPYYALATGALVATLHALFRSIALGLGTLGRFFERLKRLPATSALSYLSLGVGLLLPLAIVHDGVTALVYSRITGGRFDQKGALLHPDKDKVAFVQWLSPRMASRSGAILDRNMKQSFWVSWALGRPLKTGQRPPATPATGIERYFLIDSRFTEGAELERLARTFKVTAVGPFWAVDRGAEWAPLNGYSVVRHEPSGFERYWRSGVHALREVVADPFVTWEVRAHLAEPSNPEPNGVPASDEQLRIAHNLAVARGDGQAAEKLLSKLLTGSNQNLRTLYSDGTELLGVKYEAGASRVLTLYFRAGDAVEPGADFAVHSRVVEQLAWSLVPADWQVREVGLPPALPRKLWKAGFVYSSVTEILKRPGKERFYGSFAGPHAPGAIGRKEPLTLLELD